MAERAKGQPACKFEILWHAAQEKNYEFPKAQETHCACV